MDIYNFNTETTAIIGTDLLVARSNRTIQGQATRITGIKGVFDLMSEIK